MISKFKRFFLQKWISTKNRPQIISKPSFCFQVFDYIAYTFVIFLWIYGFYIINYLPDEIAVHFTWDGSADYWSSKYFLFLELAILTIIVSFLSYISRFYTSYNYPVEITSENAAFQYELALNFFIMMKILNVILFGYIFYITVISANNESQAKLGIFFWMIIVMIFLLNFIYKYYAKKNASKIKQKIHNLISKISQHGNRFHDFPDIP